MLGSTEPLGSVTAAYNSTSRELSAALVRVASGKKFQSAAEDLTGFLRAQGVKTDIGGYERVRQNITSFKAYTAAAVETASSVYESLTEMKDLTEQYTDADANGDTDLVAELTSQYNSLKTVVTQTLANAYVDGDKITVTASDVKTVGLDPAGDQTLAMNFSAIANVTGAGLDIDDDVTAAGGLDAQIGNMLTYMSEAKAFNAVADQQLNLTSTILNSKKAALSLITDIDEAEEMNNVIDLSIRQEAGVAMIAQANMVHRGVSKLYEM